MVSAAQLPKTYRPRAHGATTTQCRSPACPHLVSAVHAQEGYVYTPGCVAATSLASLGPCHARSRSYSSLRVPRVHRDSRDRLARLSRGRGSRGYPCRSPRAPGLGLATRLSWWGCVGLPSPVLESLLLSCPVRIGKKLFAIGEGRGRRER